jgi:hypothetical protein
MTGVRELQVHVECSELSELDRGQWSTEIIDILLIF